MGLSTHILDTALGRPAANIPLVLSQLRDEPGSAWHEIGRGHTDLDGRCRTLLGAHPLQAATYSIRFEIAEHFAAQRLTSLYPYVEIVFTVADPSQHYHIPLLISANGYTTYRGS